MSTILSVFSGILTLTTIEREPICIPLEMDEWYTRESSPIDTPGEILLETMIEDAAISDVVVAGIEQRCLRPTILVPIPLK